MVEPYRIYLSRRQPDDDDSLTPDRWSSVLGKFGNYDAASLAGFSAALQNVSSLGLTFGGGCFFGHGVNVSNGTARFILSEYSVIQ